MDVVRTYGQYCALARALDVIGERWTLLVIRELFARDSRYSDLRDALPGIATNLLATRLRHLQHHGIVDAYDAPAPVRATVYRLTERGRALAPALSALVTWGSPLLESQGDDDFRTHWMALGLPALFEGVDVSDIAPLRVLVRTGDAPAMLDVGTAGVTMRAADGVADESPGVVVEGSADAVFALLTGRDGTAAAGEASVTGPDEDVRRLRLLASRARVPT